MSFQPKSYRKFMATSLGVAVVAGVAVPVTNAEASDSIYSDISNETVNDEVFEAIQYITEKNITNGFVDGTFKPKKTLTRGEAAKIIALAMGLPIDENATSSFTDVDDEWFAPYVAALEKTDVIDGYVDNTFRPNNYIKRSEMAKMIAIAFDFSADEQENPFTDIKENDWHTNFVAALLANGITKGTSETTFSPGRELTRSEMAVLIHRSLLTQNITGSIAEINENGIVVDGTEYALSDEVKALFSEVNKAALAGAEMEFFAPLKTVEKISSLKLTASGNEDAPVVFDGQEMTFEGDLIIDGSYVEVQDLTVKGDLVVTSNVEGEFSAINVTVEGDTIILEKNESETVSIATVTEDEAALNLQFSNSSFTNVMAMRENSNLQLEGTTALEQLSIDKNAVVHASETVQIEDVIIQTGVTNVELNGSFQAVTVNNDDVITVTGSASINSIQVLGESNVSIATSGKINRVVIDSENSNLSIGENTRLTELVVPEGKTAEEIVTNFEDAKNAIDKINGEENEFFQPVVELGDTALTTDEEGNLVLIVAADADRELASLEVDHSLEGLLPEFTVGTETVTDPETGASSSYMDGVWTINFGPAVSEAIRELTDNGSITFYFVIKDEEGNQFGDMYNVTAEMTRTFDVPEVAVVDPIELGEVTLVNDEEGSLVLTVTGNSVNELATLEVDHSLEGLLPEFTVGTEAMFDLETGASSSYENGVWTINFGSAVSEAIRELTDNGTITFYFVIKDVDGNQFGDMYNVTAEMTRSFTIPAVNEDVLTEGSQFTVQNDGTIQF